jgi:hypothetical protein
MRGSGGAKHVLSPWEREQYRLLNEKERPAYAVSPERFERSVILERECQTGSDHSEVIVRSVDHIPAEIVRPANVRGNAEFQPATELADRLGRGAMVDGMIKRYRDFTGATKSVQDNFVALATTPDHTTARPNIRRKARARDRITKGEGSQHFADCSILASSFVDKDVYPVGFKVKAGAAVCVEDKSFYTDPEVTVEKILQIDTAAKGVIAAEVSIKGSVDGVAFRGALDDIKQSQIRRKLCAGRSVGAPHADIPFVVSVPLRTGRCDLCHFFARVCRPGIGQSQAGGQDH